MGPLAKRLSAAIILIFGLMPGHLSAATVPASMVITFSPLPDNRGTQILIEKIDPDVHALQLIASAAGVATFSTEIPGSPTVSVHAPDYTTTWLITASGKDSSGKIIQTGSTKTATSAAKWDINKRIRNKPEDPNLQGTLKIHFITDQWLCIVGDYNDTLRQHLLSEFGDYYYNLDKFYGYDPTWWGYWQKYRDGIKEIIYDYQPQIKTSYDSGGYFSLIDHTNGTFLKISDHGYWLNAIGAMKVYGAVTGKKIQDISDAETAHFSYLKLETPLQEGNTYELRTTHDETLSFTYHAQQTLSYAIKVDQVGYLPDAGQKYAYLGLWLGDKGKLDLTPYYNQHFYLIDLQNNTPVFTGVIKPRFTPQDNYTDLHGTDTLITGEEIGLMDFSTYTRPGSYYIYIPGVGRSWSFNIASDVTGEAFYIHAKGLYHQRCGTPKTAPYTHWTLGACHLDTYRASFEPNDYRYKARNDEFGYRDNLNQPITLDHFNVIKQTATDTRLEAVKGGWHDAADYDRRPYHLLAVQDLLAAYILFPNKFDDGQLNIPESGNGIPDIVDEAAWGMEILRHAQKTDGGIGCWIEATSHPGSASDPAKDTTRFYTSLPTRESTMDYAAYASLLARVYQKIYQTSGTLLAEQNANLYYQSALNAFNYAMNTANTIQYTWQDGSVTYSYREPTDSVNTSMTFKAALNLYFLSDKNPDYLQICHASEGPIKNWGYYEPATTQGFYYTLSNMSWTSSGQTYQQTPFQFAEIMLEPTALPIYTQIYRTKIISQADKLLNDQNRQPYFDINYSDYNHAYYDNLSWGKSCALRQGSALIVAYGLTQDPKYRNSALLLNNWQNGANPMGRTWTTGLGQVAPVNLLHHASDTEPLLEPIAGITIYGITGSLAKQNGSTGINGINIVNSIKSGTNPRISLLPNRISQGRNDLSWDEMVTSLGKTLPIWRRFWNIEAYEVAQNEFTIWETIAPSIAFTGALLPDHWMPGDTLINRQPINNKNQLPGYWFQP